MYKAAVRFMLRRNIRQLNAGNYRPALKMFAKEAVLTFPGNNSFSTANRPPQPGRGASPTHQAIVDTEKVASYDRAHGAPVSV